ncbi:MAG: signal peptidase I [Calditrichaeota bacterium]|nr:MAG: signal peptidase I [Calditrichota bacterium]
MSEFDAQPPAPPPSEDKGNPRPGHKRLETLQAILIAIFAALILRQFVIAAYKIPTPSMENTLLVGDFLLVNKFVYGARSPEWIGIPFTRYKDWGFPTGIELPEVLQFRLPALSDPRPHDIVVFRYPRDESLEYIKRCIAVGGQTVEIRDKVVFVDGKPFREPPGMKHVDPNIFPRRNAHSSLLYFRGNRDNFGPLTVAPGHYFMMGDNRDRSSDSREWGLVPRKNVVGKPLIIYFSTNGEGMLNGIRWNRLGMVIR